MGDRLIEFPIVVPDDVPLMDETQLINYISSRTCEDVGNVIHNLIITRTQEAKDFKAAITGIKQEVNDIETKASEVQGYLEGLENEFAGL